MTADRLDVVTADWPVRSRAGAAELSGLLAAYHLRTEKEKGQPVDRVADLPPRYRAEVEDPRTAFAGDTVLVAVSGRTAVGCVVVTAPVGRRVELKRLWTTPASRGRGVASALLDAALRHAAEAGADTVRLSVWRWREKAVALYARLGFAIATRWDDRDELVCMERAVEGSRHRAPEQEDQESRSGPASRR
ncbi:GNAT family N-acetyltransferase [Streptomyces sp. NPDC005899]|uniref:GNAT family N-acetyltransferase n=1 Tax=Streptomyces sp. NPDC005899 TaxID=3155716 RepID=UPI00340C9A72